MKKSIKKCVVNTLAAVTLMSALAIPSFAATPDAQATPAPEARASYYNFKVHAVYDWTRAATTRYVRKNTNNRAVVNTCSSAGGSVTPSQNFNVKLLQSGNNRVVGHKWNCQPDAREHIDYDYAYLTGQYIALSFSTRETNARATIDGSWSPDAKD